MNVCVAPFEAADCLTVCHSVTKLCKKKKNAATMHDVDMERYLGTTGVLRQRFESQIQTEVLWEHCRITELPSKDDSLGDSIHNEKVNVYSLFFVKAFRYVQ